MNRLLLDSHVLLWWANRSPALTERAIDNIRKAQEVYVSAATIWELNIKISQGKLHEPRSLVATVDEFAFRHLRITLEHGEAVRNLPWHHRDPFDRLLIAQAQVEGLTLATHDEKLLQYGVPTLLL